MTPADDNDPYDLAHMPPPPPGEHQTWQTSGRTTYENMMAAVRREHTGVRIDGGNLMWYPEAGQQVAAQDDPYGLAVPPPPD